MTAAERETAMILLALAMKELCTVLSHLVPVGNTRATSALANAAQKIDDAMQTLAQPGRQKEGD